MSTEQMIQAWKNPSLRHKLSDIPANPAGNLARELDKDELVQIAAGDSRGVTLTFSLIWPVC